MSTISKIFDVKPILNGTFFGVELEIEHASQEWATNFKQITVVEDGSLRNNGWEFITEPLPLNETINLLEAFFNNAKNRENTAVDYFLEGDVPFHYSERTSVHVHTNCTHLTLEQVTIILLLYQTVEEILFNWIGNDRDKNIFCVPWSQTLLSYDLITTFGQFVKNASVDRNKYTALNIVPLMSQGTIEWRHLYGTCDMDKISTWLKIINCFYEKMYTTTIDEVEMYITQLNTNSQYDTFLRWLFGDLHKIFMLPHYRAILENGVINMKYSIINKKKNSKNLDFKPMYSNSPSNQDIEEGSF